ncbi:MAG: TolC family protein [Terriglobia bacterium]
MERKRTSSGFTLLLVSAMYLFAALVPVNAQTFPTPGYFRRTFKQQPLTPNPHAPTGLHDYIVSGKLTLTLDDAIRLALENNTGVFVDRQSIDSAKYNVMSAYTPFDPLSTDSFSTSRNISPSYTQLSGAPTLSELSQTTTLGYSQTLETGTNYQVQFFGNKYSTNSSFFFYNPALSSTLQISVSQPLLKGRGLFANRAPIIIAQRGLNQTRAQFEGQVNDIILQAVEQYWQVVQARESLKVLQESLDLAQKTYDQNKRALELGALPPLDIYRSESEVAQRRVAVIQGEYALDQVEDRLRQTLGADLDPYVQALDLDLIDDPEPHGPLYALDLPTALEEAEENRPELEAARQQLLGDEASIRLAENSVQPSLILSGLYASNGLAGDLLGPSTPPTVISQTGFGHSLNQIFGLDNPTYGFTLTLTLPIRNHAGQAALGSARVNRRRDLYAERQAGQTIDLDVRNSVHDLEEAKLSMSAAKVALDLAHKTLQAEQRKYELGTETIFFVLEAQTELASAEQSLVQSEINYQIAVNEVEHATGGLLSRYRVQVEKLAG